MKIKLGMANDYGRDKFDIELDETDLQRICTKYGLPDPDVLDTDQADLLLTTEAERYILVQAPKFGRDVEGVRQQMRENREHMVTIVQVITGFTEADARERVGLEPK